MTDLTEDWLVDKAFAAKTPFGMGAENTFAGALSLFRRRYSKDLAGADVAVLGVPYDQAVTNRAGTRFGPRAIRAVSSQIAWKGGPWRWPFDPFELLNVIDTGDLDFDHGRADLFPETLEARAAEIIATGARLLSLGGDHFATYPLLKAHAARHGPLALVQFDAHSDTWTDDREPDQPRRIDHGTMFYHAVKDGIIDASRSVQVGIRTGNDDPLGIETLDADWVLDHKPGEVASRICEIVGEGPVYLTFDIDGLDPAFAPGTGTPVCGGMSTNQAERILCGLTGLDLVGMDVVEVSPAYDVGDVTALAGATLALNMICLWADRKSRGLF